MIGKWQTTYLKVEFETYNKSDSIFVFEDKFDAENKLVAQSEYFEDGTFKAWYLKPNGEKDGESVGKWSVVNDSLFLRYNYLGNEMNPAYSFELSETGFKARSLYDWDRDGEKDDQLIMETKRLK